MTLTLYLASFMASARVMALTAPLKKEVNIQNIDIDLENDILIKEGWYFFLNFCRKIL